MRVVCDDGPLAESEFEVDSCPRAVRCTVTARGRKDILNLPDDEPRPTEAVHWYEIENLTHICISDGEGRGCNAVAHLAHRPNVRSLR